MVCVPMQQLPGQKSDMFLNSNPTFSTTFSRYRFVYCFILFDFFLCVHVSRFLSRVRNYLCCSVQLIIFRIRSILYCTQVFWGSGGSNIPGVSLGHGCQLYGIHYSNVTLLSWLKSLDSCHCWPGAIIPELAEHVSESSAFPWAA